MKVRDLKVSGIPFVPYLIMLAVTFTAMYMGKLPGGLIGSLPAMILIGAGLNQIGNITPIVKTYLGGGPIIVIFVSAALFTYTDVFGWLFTESVTADIVTFTKGGGFLTFYIAALITGSILGMNRKLLIKASIRFFPAIFGGIICSFLLVGLVGMVFYDGFIEAIAFIGMPIMGGGMGAGALPIAEIYAAAGVVSDPVKALSLIVPALAIGNAFAIVVAGLLDRLGKIHPELSGEGQLMANGESNFDATEDDSKLEMHHIGWGIAMAGAFIAVGKILSVFIPIHYYALTIITVAIFKLLNVVPDYLVEAARNWYKVVAKNFTPALLVGIGAAYTDLPSIIDAISPSFVILVLVVIIGAALGAGFIGKLVGFNFVESAIAAGLCMANMGGTGDVAVLGAANRMDLMPFAQISSRIGGAIMLLIASGLALLI